MAITNQSTLLNAATARQVITFLKGFSSNSLGAWAAGSTYSLWYMQGFPGPGNSNPSSEIPTSLTAGAFPLTDAAPGKQLYLGKMCARQIWRLGSPAGLYPGRIVLRLYDRLFHAGVNFTSQTQTITLNGPTVTRGAVNGIGNEILVEAYGLVQSGTSTVVYVNQSGSNATTPAFHWNTTSTDGSGGRSVQFSRAAADLGVQSIVSISVASMPYPPKQVTVMIAREVAQYSYNFTQSEWLDALDLGLPPIDNGACLFMMTESPVASSNTPYGIMGRIEIYQQ